MGRRAGVGPEVDRRAAITCPRRRYRRYRTLLHFSNFINDFAVSSMLCVST